MGKRRRSTPREKELQLLLSVERSLTDLRRYYGRPTQRYDFVLDTLTKVQAERLMLQQAMAGDADAIRHRKMGVTTDAAHTLG